MANVNAELDVTTTHIEKIMLTLNPAISETERRQYLAGYIDCLGDQNQISPETRNELYGLYCF